MDTARAPAPAEEDAESTTSSSSSSSSPLPTPLPPTYSQAHAAGHRQVFPYLPSAHAIDGSNDAVTTADLKPPPPPTLHANAPPPMDRPLAGRPPASTAAPLGAGSVTQAHSDCSGSSSAVAAPQQHSVMPACDQSSCLQQRSALSIRMRRAQLLAAQASTQRDGARHMAASLNAELHEVGAHTLTMPPLPCSPPFPHPLVTYRHMRHFLEPMRRHAGAMLWLLVHKP